MSNRDKRQTYNMSDTDSSSSSDTKRRPTNKKDQSIKVPKIKPRSNKQSREDDDPTKQQTDNLELFMNKINKYSGKKLKTVQDVISFITSLHEKCEGLEIDLQKEIDENKRKYTKEIKQLKEDLEEERETNEELRDQLKGSNKKVSKDLKKSESKVTELEEENRKKCEEIKEKEKEIRILIQKLDSMKAENNDLQNNNRMFQDQTKQFQSRVNEMQKENSNLKKEANTIRNELENELAKLKNETQNLEQNITAKDKAIGAIKNKLNIKENETRELNDKIVGISAEMEQYKRDLMHEKQNSMKLSNDFENRKTYFEKKIKNMENEIQEIRVKKFRNGTENSPNNNGAGFNNEQNDRLPLWWDKHKEDHTNERRPLVQCRNCGEHIPITEIAQHGQMCDQLLNNRYD